jgi:hypothetical protein
MYCTVRINEKEKRAIQPDPARYDNMLLPSAGPSKPMASAPVQNVSAVNIEY